MQNFCGKCGNKLDKNEKVCSKCNTHVHEDNAKPKMDIALKILIIFGIIVLAVIITIAIILYRNEYKTFKMKKDYVEPYLKKTYGDEDFDIKYDSSGKCIVSGDCSFDPVMGCDGGSCVPYKYLENDKCKSYYYDIKKGDELFIVTVVTLPTGIYAVEGKGMYGDGKLKRTTTTTQPIIGDDFKYKTTSNVVNYQ